MNLPGFIAYVLGYDPLPFMPKGSLGIALTIGIVFCGYELYSLFLKAVKGKK